MYKDFKNKTKQVSGILKVISHEKRLWILCLLLEWEKNIFELQETLGISQSLTSQFLLKMKDMWILKSVKRWKEVYYDIADSNIKELMLSLKNIYC